MREPSLSVYSLFQISSSTFHVIDLVICFTVGIFGLGAGDIGLKNLGFSIKVANLYEEGSVHAFLYQNITQVQFRYMVTRSVLRSEHHL